MRVRIARRVREYLEGTQDYYDAYRANLIGPAAPTSLHLMRKVQGATLRKDGSVTVELSPDEVEDLRVFNEAFAVAAHQDLSDPDNRGDWNAAQALNRHIGPPDIDHS